MTPLAAGLYGFPVEVSASATFGVCVSPPPFVPFAEYAVGPGPGGPFTYLGPAGFVTIGWTGSVWRAQCNVQGFTFFADLAQSAPGAPFIGIKNASVPFQGLCFRTMTVKWTPEAICTSLWVRNYLDARATAGGPVWSINQPFVDLAGSTVRWEEQVCPLWVPSHARGLTYKVGSQSGPVVSGQKIRFYAG